MNEMRSDEELKKEIQDAVKEGTAVLGYRESIESIKNDSPKGVVIANNVPDDKLDEINHNTRLSAIEVDVFDGDSKELGLTCGKPFPVLVLVIKNE